jgi:addiction module HigA family antidote
MTAKELIQEMHPGRTIMEDVAKPLGLSVNALAKRLHVPASRLNDIVRGHRGVTADTALRIARYLGTSPQFWLNLQSTYDLKVAQFAQGRIINKQVRPRAAA